MPTIPYNFQSDFRIKCIPLNYGLTMNVIYRLGYLCSSAMLQRFDAFIIVCCGTFYLYQKIPGPAIWIMHLAIL